MQIDKYPRPDASLADKMGWTIYQLVRYRNFHKLCLPIYYLICMVWISALVAWMGTAGYLVAIPICIVLNVAYDYITWFFLVRFYDGLNKYMWSKEFKSNDELMLSILFNNVGNYLDNKDEAIKDRLFQRLKDNYLDLKKQRENNEQPGTGGGQTKA